MLKTFYVKERMRYFGMFITNINFGGGRCLAYRARIIARPGGDACKVMSN